MLKMFKNGLKCLKNIGGVFLVLFFIVALICAILLPIAYLDGTAKSTYIKKAQNIDIPWYLAGSLSVNINGVSITPSSVEHNKN